MKNNNDDFLLELEAFDPKWQIRYNTMLSAVTAAGMRGEYFLWLRTAAGEAHSKAIEGVADTLAANEAERRSIEAARRMIRGN